MRLILLAITMLIGFTLAACAPLIKVSGYVPLETELTKLKLGVSTKLEVVKYLGEPLTLKFDSSNRLLFVQQKVETVAFFRPRVIDRTVIQLTFNESDILSKIERFEGSALEPLTLETEITRSEGRKLTFWQQMFGNIGNFSTEQFLD